VAEGLAKGGESSPTTASTNRAKTVWMEEIKNDIWHLGKKPKLLHATSYGIFPVGQSRFTNPDDFSSDLSLTILDGSNRGTAQTGSSSSITLSASDVSAEVYILGREILIISGTGQGSYSQIIAYNTTTKVATVTPEFSTAPDSTSGYMIVDTEWPVEQRPIYERDTVFQTPLTGIATKFYPIGDEDFGEFILEKAPDRVYGARLRYYANIMLIDIDSTHMSTIYQRWRQIFVEGIRFKKLDDEDDVRANDAYTRYRKVLYDLITRETYGMDISNILDRVSDYR
jgi:hypothetical protein